MIAQPRTPVAGDLAYPIVFDLSGSQSAMGGMTDVLDRVFRSVAESAIHQQAFRIDSVGSEGGCLPSVIHRASMLIAHLYSKVLRSGRDWTAPHATVTSPDEMTFEWWKGSKKLTVYVSDEDTEAVWRVSGTDGDSRNEQEDPSQQQLLQLWRWLTSG